MNITTPGHEYALASSDNADNQILRFIQQKVERGSIKLQSGKEASDPKLVTDVPGTKATEVLEALQDRLEFMYSRFSDLRVLLAAHHVELALLQLNELEAGLARAKIEGAPVI